MAKINVVPSSIARLNTAREELSKIIYKDCKESGVHGEAFFKALEKFIEATISAKLNARY